MVTGNKIVPTSVNIYLADVKIAPFKPPNVDAATNKGMIHDMTPNILSANV